MILLELYREIAYEVMDKVLELEAEAHGRTTRNDRNSSVDGKFRDDSISSSHDSVNNISIYISDDNLIYNSTNYIISTTNSNTTHNLNTVYA
jgi:hypothetical protein